MVGASMGAMMGGVVRCYRPEGLGRAASMSVQDGTRASEA